MARDRCVSCGRQFLVASGRENVWVFDGRATSGLTLMLDGEAYPVCFDCLDALPEHPTPGDLEPGSSAGEGPR
ncbi:MAG: DUF7561 family protein [Halobacteriota archaeon]